MNPALSPDVSLYQLALSSESPPASLQLSPATLKVALDTVFNILVEQSIPAVIWVKLPRGGVWQASYDYYAHSAGLPKTLYWFTNQRDDTEELANQAVRPATEPDIVGARSMLDREANLTPAVQAPLWNIVLPTDSPLRREYFLIVWSATVKLALLAHRPRSMQTVRSSETIALADTLGPMGESHERRQLLLALHVLDVSLIEQILERLEQVAAATDSVISPWQSLLAEFPKDEPDPSVLGQLLSHQLHQYEELVQRNQYHRRQAELAESLQSQNEVLITALRLKDDFLNTLGQELRTPLTTIKTALSLLNSPNLKQPQRQRYMDMITKECDRQSSLITSLLDLVQIDQAVEQSNLEAIRLVEIVPGVVSTYQPLAEEKGVRLAYTVPEDLPPVACMANWLRQIVINLLHNGIKFTPEGGQVWVRARLHDRHVQLDVRDTGIGIAASELPKVFDRFYRTRQSDDSSGAGLGLTIVQQLLIHCGGSISVKSKVGEGSIFTVLLPIHPNAPEPDAA
jgi:signal transduction histidine kinase